MEFDPTDLIDVRETGEPVRLAARSEGVEGGAP